MPRLKGKVALVSGGAKGQGAEEAKLFADEGASVVLGDILDDEGQDVAHQINQSGGNAIYVHLDVTKKNDWDEAVKETSSIYGKLDILVNNAGILIMKGLTETTESEWDLVQDINAKGVFLGSQAVIPEMIRNGGGSIVNISSVAGLIGSRYTAYGASKGLVRLLTKSTAVQYGPQKIRCNSVHPGIIATDMVKDMIGTDAGREMQLNRTPLNIIANSMDVALGVLYLASDEARYVTGSELVIDGGITAQ